MEDGRTQRETCASVIYVIKMKLGMNTTIFWNAIFLAVFEKKHIGTYYIKSAIKFCQLMKTKNNIKLNKICRFIKVINKAVCAPG